MSEKPAAICGSFTLHDFPVGGAASPDVLINGVSAWRAGDKHICRLHGPEDVRLGVDHVLINGRNAVREGDFLQGAGPSNRITSGSVNVFIGPPALTGTGSKANIEWFCGRWCDLVGRWSEMTPEQRRQAYTELLYEQFRRLGMPRPNFNENAAPPSAGAFDQATWTVMMPAGTFDTSPPPSRLGEATLHETRHAEQVYAAARERAGRHQGGSATGGSGAGDGNDKLSEAELDEVSVSPPHVDAAAYRNPLDPDSPEGKWARLQSDEHLSKEGRKQFREIVNEINEAGKVKDKDPDRYSRAYDAYLNRPGGADADQVGQLAATCDCAGRAKHGIKKRTP